MLVKVVAKNSRGELRIKCPVCESKWFTRDGISLHLMHTMDKDHEAFRIANLERIEKVVIQHRWKEPLF